MGNTFTWLPVGRPGEWVSRDSVVFVDCVRLCVSSCLEPSSSLYVLGFDCDVDGLLKYSINAQWKMFGNSD